MANPAMELVSLRDLTRSSIPKLKAVIESITLLAKTEPELAAGLAETAFMLADYLESDVENSIELIESAMAGGAHE